MAVTALEIKSRQPYADGESFGDAGPCELVDAEVRFAVDPDHPANELITDLKLAPRDAGGKVSFSADFRMIRPVDPQKRNRRVFLEVLNRGRQRALRYINDAPENLDAGLRPGGGFLMRQGYTLAWCGWQHDVPDSPGRLHIRVPGAVTSAGPISGKIAVSFQPNAASPTQLLSDRGQRNNPAADLDEPGAVLTVRNHEYAPIQVLPRDQWSFARIEDGRVVPDAGYVYLASGFVPGKVYRVIYSTPAAPVVGLGMVATRDIAAFLRYGAEQEGNPCAGGIERAYAFGASQSGRFLRHMLYLGLNEDESGRVALDGIIAHIAGGRRGEFNLRFGQPSNVLEHSVGSMFPFSDVEQTDPETGHTGGLLDRLTASGKAPKVFFTNTAAEYWGGHAALIHTDVTGSHDIAHSESVRIYHFAGTHHSSGRFPLGDVDPATGARGWHAFNAVDLTPLLRSAVFRLDRWVSHGEAPPPSRHPRLDDGTAVLPENTAAAFRGLPGVDFPAHPRYLCRLDFGLEQGVATRLPAAVGKPYPNLVSAVDRDGNELAGIRLPDLTVPLATHTGWNTRHPDVGGTGQTIPMIGSTMPFPPNREAREASGDSRLSIDERYASRDSYLEQVRDAARKLAGERYLLEEDVETVVQHAAERYDSFRSRIKEVQAAND
ncbi:MAG: alpha/beta hydrolase domain-containing protein [Dehalococcoidia bacterium]|nr:alpha/beta hydrolase domain-containing protein [Dehalococcoidia bacterium]